MTARSVVQLMLALLGGSLAACGSKESVMLSAHLESPELTVTSQTLVTSVTGSFDLELALGDRASDPSTVTLGPFSVHRDNIALLDPLNLEADPPFPMEIGVGGSKHVDMTIMNPDADAGLASDLCSAQLQIVGTLTDTLGDDRSLTVSSGLFRADCL
jgi:hypothetical protein